MVQSILISMYFLVFNMFWQISRIVYQLLHLNHLPLTWISLPPVGLKPQMQRQVCKCCFYLYALCILICYKSYTTLSCPFFFYIFSSTNVHWYVGLFPALLTQLHTSPNKGMFWHCFYKPGLQGYTSYIISWLSLCK